MIIEGRHADVGSGIFISDIQRESVAEEVSPIQSKAKTILDEMITTRKKNKNNNNFPGRTRRR